MAKIIFSLTDAQAEALMMLQDATTSKMSTYFAIGTRLTDSLAAKGLIDLRKSYSEPTLTKLGVAAAAIAKASLSRDPEQG